MCVLRISMQFRPDGDRLIQNGFSPILCISFVIYPLIPSQPSCQKPQNSRGLYRLQDEVTTDNDRRGLTTDQEKKGSRVVGRHVPQIY